LQQIPIWSVIAETLFAKRRGQCLPRGNYVLRHHGIARLHGKSLAKFPGVRSGGVQARQVDRRKTVLLAGVDRQDDPQLIAAALGARVDRGVVIALAAQQLGEEVGVRARAAADLGRVGAVLVFGFERRLLPESLEQLLGPADRGQPLNRDGVADGPANLRRFRERLLFAFHRCSDLRRRRGLLHVELRPFDAKVWQGRHGRAGVELGFLRGRRWRLLLILGQSRRGTERHAASRTQQPCGPSDPSPPGHQERSLTRRA